MTTNQTYQDRIKHIDKMISIYHKSFKSAPYPARIKSTIETLEQEKHRLEGIYVNQAKLDKYFKNKKVVNL